MKIIDFIFSSRPLLIMPAWTVYLVCLHYHHQLSGDKFDGLDLAVLFCLSGVFAGAIYLNQVYDYESDLLNEKVGFLQKKIITPKEMMLAAVVLTITAAAVGGLIAWNTLMIVILVFVMGYIYSVPPLRLKDNPFFNLFINGFTYGFLVPLATMPDLSLHNAGLLGWDNPFYFLCTLVSVTALTTVPDMKGDERTGTRTIAVVLRRTGTLLVALVFMLAALLLAYRSGFELLAGLAAVATLLILAALFINTEKMILLAVKLPLLLVTLLAGYFYPLYLLFIVALILSLRIYYRKRFGIIYPKMT
ncbi:MAG: UbiA family prenyltransferase [Candidatus Zixiibacteriota bacterium]